jgi:hypothetical protein
MEIFDALFFFPVAFFYFAPDVFSQIDQNMPLAKFLMFSCTAADDSANTFVLYFLWVVAK